MPENTMSIAIQSKAGSPIRHDELEQPLPTTQTALIQLWEIYFSSEKRPIPVETTPEFEDAWANLESKHGLKFDELAKWQACLDHYCEHRHPGARVIYLWSEGNPPAVIAVGEQEIALFQKHFSDKLIHLARIRYPVEGLLS